MHGVLGLSCEWISAAAFFDEPSLCYYISLHFLIIDPSIICCQCVCNWENRDGMFLEVEGIIRRQIKVSSISPRRLSYNFSFLSLLVLRSLLLFSFLSGLFLELDSDVNPPECATFPRHSLPSRSGSCSGNQVSSSLGLDLSSLVKKNRWRRCVL